MKVAQRQRQYLSSTSLISGVGLSEYLNKGLFHCFVGSGHLMVPNQWCFANLLFYLALRVTNSSNSSWPDLLKINWDYTLLCGEEEYWLRIMPIITCPRQDPSQLMPTRPCSWRNPSCSRLCLNQSTLTVTIWVTLKGEGKGISNSYGNP